LSPTFYRGCWHVVSRDLFATYRPCSSVAKGFYDPKAVITHAASLHQGFPHCAISLTAASRRSLGRVSVPVWRVVLSDPLPVVGLVRRYRTNYLMGRSPLSQRVAPFLMRLYSAPAYPVLASLSKRYPRLEGRLATCSSPVRHWSIAAPVRLACVRHAASVHPEPGSNSPSWCWSAGASPPLIRPDRRIDWLLCSSALLCC